MILRLWFPFLLAGFIRHLGFARSGAIPHQLDWIKGWDGSTLVVPLGCVPSGWEDKLPSHRGGVGG